MRLGGHRASPVDLPPPRPSFGECGGGRRRRPALRPAGHVLVLLLAILGFPGLAAAAHEPVPSAPLLEAVLERLETRGAFESPFRQVNYWIVFDEADTARGVLTLVPPDRFRLDYTHPEGHLVVSDGRYVWTVIPEERQVLRATHEATTGWGELFCRGLEEAADSLAQVGEDPAWGEWGIDSLHVEVALEGALPVGYGYVDEEGNRIGFRFEAPRFPAGVAPVRFRFELPEGYELFEVD